jgi:hypothetical protein
VPSLPGQPSGDHTAYEDTKFTGDPAQPYNISTAVKQKCSCKGNVDAEWREEIGTAAGVIAEQRQMEYLSRYIEIIGPTPAKGTGVLVCGWHTVKIAGHLGLQVKHHKHHELVHRLRTVYRLTRKRGIEVMQQERDYAHWFRVNDRPKVDSDSLGPYRFFHQPTTDPLIYKTTPVVAQRFLAAMLNRPDADLSEWKARGTINISAFKWVLQSEILRPILDHEYNMYMWHQRRINNRDNYGWLRTMFHGLIQQLVRMYPGYWMLYAALRPDMVAWMISYPYYAKYTAPGDRTEFRHIDLNAQLMSQRDYGVN